jgi:hypothetical protein
MTVGHWAQQMAASTAVPSDVRKAVHLEKTMVGWMDLTTVGC